MTPCKIAQDQIVRRTLCDLLSRSALKELTVTSSLHALFDAALPVARLVDVLAFTLVQDVPAKQRLLEELDPAKRGRCWCGICWPWRQHSRRKRRRFPPPTPPGPALEHQLITGYPASAIIETRKWKTENA